MITKNGELINHSIKFEITIPCGKFDANFVKYTSDNDDIQFAAYELMSLFGFDVDYIANLIVTKLD